MKTAALNHADLLLCQGAYQNTPIPPFALGLEGAGTVIAVGPGTQTAIGTRVAVFAGSGCLADTVNVSEQAVATLPDKLAFPSAAAVPVVYTTAHLGLIRRAALTAGETLLVTGAGGGAGLAAVRLGRAFGARVVAMARSEDHRDAARSAGAELTLSSEAEANEITKTLKDLGGLNVVYDTVGGPGLDAVLRALVPEGRLVLVGFAGGAPTLRPNHILVKNQTLIGLNISGYRTFAPAELKSSLETVLEMTAAGSLIVDIGHRFVFDDLPEAVSLLKSRAGIGKIVIDIDQSSE